MNKLLNKLVEQSYDTVPHERDWDATSQVFNKEKFAELIIKECVNQCQQEWYYTNNVSAFTEGTDPRMVGIRIGIKQGAMKCGVRIAKRFGLNDE
jgi:hypothetical protein